MHVHEALERLDAIHGHLARSEVYRGFRVPAVALVGVIGILAAALQSHFPDCVSGINFAVYWAGVAALGGLIGTVAGLRAYLFEEDDFARRRTQRVMFQFFPCILAGGAITLGMVRSGPEAFAFLPGVWATVFGLGIIAASPYLPSNVGRIGFAYIVAGAMLLLSTRAGAEPAAWAVGGVFGAGHFAVALALWNGQRMENA